MNEKVRKKLIEHSLPLEAINAASSREKSVRHGHPSTLHLWWARRPLAACRAVLFAQLVDDPSSWPGEFPTRADQDHERRRLHKVMENMVEWPKSNRQDQNRFKRAIETARSEIARSIARENGHTGLDLSDANAVLDYLQTEGPPVYDPFCGGGSIPLEAQRLGLRAYGSDLNPVAVLITKALVEFPPKFTGLPPIHPDAEYVEERSWEGAQGLAEDVRRYGQWMRDEAEKRIGQLYPKAKLSDGSEATVIAWLWARTVASPDPAHKGAHVPLASSFVLSSKKGKEAIVVPTRDPEAQDGWRFDVKAGDVSSEEIGKARLGTKSSRGSNFVCLLSGAPIESAYVKTEGRAGRLDARLMAVVAQGDRSRIYLAPSDEQEKSAVVSIPDVAEIQHSLPNDPRNFWTVDYGLDRFDRLFSARQLTAITTFSNLVSEARESVLKDAKRSEALQIRNDDRPLAKGGSGVLAYADAVATYLGMNVSRLANRQATLTFWDPGGQNVQQVFARQALPMVWDFCEANPFSDSSGNFLGQAKYLTAALENAPALSSGYIQLGDAAQTQYKDETLICTDPPYYDNIGYADLSDFFYVWLRRSLRSLQPDLFRRLLTPKNDELVATPYRHSGRENADLMFMNGMRRALTHVALAENDHPFVLFYAYKQSEKKEANLFSPGWVSFLEAIIASNFQVDGTWPMDTELAGNLKKRVNALASSVVLVCRRRDPLAVSTTRRDFLRELRVEMASALAGQAVSIPLPDRRQAAIGPGMGVFSKYKSVREADDSEMTVATALALINQEIDKLLADGTEALDTESRFALEWYEQFGFAQQKSGAGRAIAMLNGFNLSEARMNRSGLFLSKGGDAKLLARSEMPTDWRPSTDDTFTAWEMAQHLARVLRAEDGGTDAAARLLAEKRDSGPDVLLIAERLFDMETNRGNAGEALVWNELQQAWSEILTAADRFEGAAQGEKFEQAELRI